tara:strand:- start:5460 stop:5807 length:348 start_codon:yes stop_codon:yes gene_type:complete
MAKFIAIEVSQNASALLNGEHLVQADQVTAIQQTAAETVGIVLSNSTSSHKQVTLTAAVDDGTGSISANPNYSGNQLEQAINYSLTANPGGVKAKVFPLKDSDDKKVYIIDIVYS